MHAKMWSDMFVLGLPVLDKILRPLFVNAFLTVALRLAGKRELAQLNPFDLVVLLTLSNTVQNAIIGDDSTATGRLIGAATLLLVNYLVVRSLCGHGKIERIIEGNEDVLIEKGKSLQRHLKKELIPLPELEAAAHRQGFSSLSDVDRAVFEPSGMISFFAKQPVPDELRHREVMDRLEHLAQELAQLRSQPAVRGS